VIFAPGAGMTPAVSDAADALVARLLNELRSA
jgi:hypothetical protein